jgi:hypothetical protein
MPASGPEILKRKDKLKAMEMNHRDRWDKIAKLFDPYTRGIITRQKNGESVTYDIYDSTGEQALDTLGKFIAGEIINPKRKYIEIRPSDPELQDDDTCKEWCEESRDRMMDALARSNFYTEAPLAIKQVAGYGTASLFWTEKAAMPWERNTGTFRGLYFRCDKVGRFLIAVNGNGEVDTNYRNFKLSARAANQLFPNAPDQCQFKRALESEKPDQDFEFWHAVYPRTEAGYGAKGFPWASCYVEEASKEIVDESGFKQFRFACPRWDIVPGETYGRGACELVYNDMTTKNKAREMMLQAAALKIRPPVFSRFDSIIGSLRIKPAGLTTVNTHGQRIQDCIVPWDAGGDLKFAQIEDDKLKQAIRAGLYVDVIQQVLEMDLKEVNNYTLAKKLELLYQILGSTYGRFEKEFLKALFDPLVVYLFEQGLFSPPPQALVEGGGGVDITFENQLAKAQAADEAGALNKTFGDLSPIITYQVQTAGMAEVLDGFDFDKWRDTIAARNGVPATVTRSEAEVKQIRDARTKAQLQQKQQQDLMQMSQGAKNIAPLVQSMQGMPQLPAPA